MSTKFQGDMAAIKRSERPERGELEAETRAKVDGRRLRSSRLKRSEPMHFRFTKETRELIERLSLGLNRSFVEVVEDALKLLDKQTKGGSRPPK